MTQTEFYIWGLASIWGVALGIFYFGGLWWTICSLPRLTSPRFFLAASFIIRTALVLLGFWLVLHRNIGAFFFTIGAFTITRLILVRKLGLSKVTME